MSVFSQGSQEAPSFLSSYRLSMFSVELEQVLFFCRVKTGPFFFVELEQVLFFVELKQVLFFVELEQVLFFVELLQTVLVFC